MSKKENFRMKIFNIHGELENVDVRPSTYPLKGRSKSQLQTEVGEFLQNNYPREAILEEFTIPGSRMSMDFFLPQLKLCVEIDGVQHETHTSFFHGNRSTSTKYAKQRMRDNVKEQWCELNKFKLIRIETKEDLKCLLSRNRSKSLMIFWISMNKSRLDFPIGSKLRHQST